MSATALQLNLTSTLFVASGGASTGLVHVTAFMIDQGGELIEFMGDNNRYPTVIANSVNKPKISITGGDVATYNGVANGTVGTFTATEPDAEAATGGAINWSMVNAVKESNNVNASWGQFGSGTVSFRAFSSDGVTNPLTIASRS